MPNSELLPNSDQFSMIIDILAHPHLGRERELMSPIYRYGHYEQVFITGDELVHLGTIFKRRSSGQE